jgi:hypothetical protein
VVQVPEHVLQGGCHHIDLRRNKTRNINVRASQIAWISTQGTHALLVSFSVLRVEKTTRLLAAKLIKPAFSSHI